MGQGTSHRLFCSLQPTGRRDREADPEPWDYDAVLSDPQPVVTFAPRLRSAPTRRRKPWLAYLRDRSGVALRCWTGELVTSPGRELGGHAEAVPAHNGVAPLDRLGVQASKAPDPCLRAPEESGDGGGARNSHRVAHPRGPVGRCSRLLRLLPPSIRSLAEATVAKVDGPSGAVEASP
jgi:hypothetical protein